MLVLLKGVDDKQAGIKKVKDGLAKNYLKDVKFDEPSETKGGAMVITGTGKGKKSGVDVVFAAGVFDAGERPIRRCGIRRRFQNRGLLQGDGPGNLPDDSSREGLPTIRQ